MRRVTSIAIAALLLAGVPDGARAQLHLGAQGSMAFDRPSDETTTGVGVKAVLGLPAIPIEVHGSVDYFFPDCDPVDCSFWEANANAVFRLPLPGAPLRPYLGAGLNYQSFGVDDVPAGVAVSDASGTGINILGGVELGATPLIRPFVEARYEIIDSDGLENQLVLSAGIIL